MAKRLVLLACAVLISLLACDQPPTPTPTPAPTPAPTARPPITVWPKIDRRPSPWIWQRDRPTALPTYDPSSADPFQMDLRCLDLSALDLRGAGGDLLYATYDSLTRWPAPERLPAGFDPGRIMELGRNPGLGVRSLHARGITGRGVAIAIVDQPLIVEHQEYADRIRLYEEIAVQPHVSSQMHGPAVASIAVGKTVGVAPGADLYYIATWAFDPARRTATSGRDFRFYAQAVRRILEVNRQLPVGQKIRVMSLSVGWGAQEPGYDEMTAATRQAKEAGMLVVSSSIEQTHGFRINGLGRAPLADPERFESYEAGLFWAGQPASMGDLSKRLHAPMDSRAVAGPTGADGYAFYRAGGFSWVAPCLAGVYALALQVDPTLTPERFWALAMETGRTVEWKRGEEVLRLGPIVDPVAVVEAVGNAYNRGRWARDPHARPEPQPEATRHAPLSL